MAVLAGRRTRARVTLTGVGGTGRQGAVEPRTPLTGDG